MYYTDILSTTKPIRNAFLYKFQSFGGLRNLFAVYRLNSSVLRTKLCFMNHWVWLSSVFK